MLILLRHGRTEANAAGLLQGRLDLPLDDIGRRQATAAARHIGPVDRIVSSPLRRARETAAAFGSDVAVDDRWLELDYGELDGVPMGDVAASTWTKWREDEQFAPPGGESLAELAARVFVATEEMVAEATHRDIVVVSHVSPIKAAVAWALGMGVGLQWRLHLGQAAICRIDGRGVLPAVVAFNERCHLSSAGAASD